MTNEFEFDAFLQDTPRQPFQYGVDDALKALPIQDPDTLIPVEVLFGFSDASPDDLPRIQAVWDQLPASQRIAIMNRVAEASEVDFTLDYAQFARVGYTDSDPHVRVAAIKAAWADINPQTLQILLDLTRNDPVDAVRAAAIGQAGAFIELSELEEFDADAAAEAEVLALQLFNDPQQDLEVRRHALEAVSNASRQEVPAMIEAAYNHEHPLMRLSAVVAMGNSCDERWSRQVDFELSSDSTEMCFEAIQSAGQIGLTGSVNKLSELGYSQDEQLREAAIWALGEIGGEQALDALEELLGYASDQNDEELVDSIEEALAMAEMMTDLENDWLDDSDDSEDDID